MLLDEARMTARVRHPNVVATLDVVQTVDELLLAME
jgi:serine/threonine-protein kinase